MATFDRFDICEAFYVYATLWGHDAFTNRVQARLRAIGFSPGASRDAGSLRSLSENGREVYNALVERQETTRSGYVPCACCGDDCMGVLVRGMRADVPRGTDFCEACAEAGCEVEARDAGECKAACECDVCGAECARDEVCCGPAAEGDGQ